MKAVILRAYGDVDQLSYEDDDLPPVGDNEVRVRLRATSINPIDWKLRSGAMKDVYPLDLPEILGLDVSGEIDELGAGVTGWERGQRVMGLGNGSYAEYTTVKAHTLCLIPDALSFEQAAALPLVLLTGAQVVERGAKVQPGQTVLVTGALGGVGRTAVHVAKAHGAKVIAGVRAARLEEATKLGADQVVALDDETELGHLHDLDVVIDTVGGVVQQHTIKLLRDNGVFATVTGAPPQSPERGIQTVGYRVAPDASRLSELSFDVASGALTIPIADTMPLAEVRVATTLAERAGVGGKVILTM